MAKVDRTRFAAGEVSKNVAPVSDLARQQAAVAICENFVVLLEGGLTRRPGTRFVCELKDMSERGKGIEFQFSDSDTYSILFNGNRVRFLQNGGVVLSGPNPYQIVSPYLEADLPNLRWAQSGNLIFLACAGHPVRVLTRDGPADWTLTDYLTTDGPVGPQNLDAAKTIQASGVTGSVTLTYVGATFREVEDIGTVWRIDEPDYSLVAQWKGNETGLANGDQRRNGGNVYSAAVTGGSNGADAGPNPPTHPEGAVSAGKGNPTWTFLHAGYGVARLTAVAGGGATATALVMKRLPDSVVAQASYRWYPPAWGSGGRGGFPELVRLCKDALFFARTDGWWLSTPNDFYNFGINFDDGAATALAGRFLSPDGKRIAIRWAMQLGVLLIGTSSSEISLRGQTSFSPLSIDDLNPVPEETEGAAAHVPELVTGGAIFIGKNRQRLHYAKFDPLGEKVDMQELTLSARGILGGGAQTLAFQKDPNAVLFVQNTNRLVAVTFMPKEEVLGFSRHPMTNGTVEDCWNVTAAGGSRDDVYFIVRRTIGGVTKRYVEKLEPFFEPLVPSVPTAALAFFVDSGLSYSGVSVTTLSGLDHLEGQEVAMLLNGKERPRQTVVDGTVIVDPPNHTPNMTAIVGLPIVAKVRSLPIEFPPGQQSVKGLMRQGDAIVEVVDSVGGILSINDGPPEELFETGTLDYGAALPLHTGKLQPQNEVPSATEMVLEIVCDNCLPFTLAGWVPDMQISEEAA